MTIPNRVRRYGFALLILVLGVLLMTLPVIKDKPGTPAIAIFLIILFSALYGGLGPGLMVTALIALMATPLDLPLWRIVRLVLFLVGGTSISILAEVLHAARRRAEESRQALAAVLTSIGDAVIATDTSGRVTFANPVATSLTGWTLEEARGRSLGEIFVIVDETTRHPAVDPVARALREGIVVGLANHTLLISRDGTERPIHDSAAPIRDGAGETIGAVLVFRDDSQRRGYELELIEASRRKDEFLAMLAHELRNPLASIKSAVALLGTEEAERHLAWTRDILDRQVGHLARLLDDLLDVARITRGRVVLQTEILDATEVLHRVVESMQSLIEEREHRVDVAILGGPKWIEADPIRLEQVMVNLLNNAIKYTPTGGRIRISAEQDGADVVLRVEDNGPGIPPEILPRIFELFAQGERSPDRLEGGLGVGLTIVKGLVELHGGCVEVRSLGPNQGSMFAVRLPIAEGRSKPTDSFPTSTSSVVPPEPYRARILIIDDNKDFARGLSRLLQIMGHDVEMAHDGPEGISAAQAYGPEVLLLDIGLPNLDGYEVARQLRQEETFQRSLFIAISGYGQEEDRRRSWEAGIDHHLIKPVDVEMIMGLIAESRSSG